MSPTLLHSAQEPCFRATPNRTRGFTILELMVCALLMSVLALVAIPVSERQVQRTKERELKTALREIRGGLDAYRRAVAEGRIERAGNESGYPKNLRDLELPIRDAKTAAEGAIPLRILRRLPRDPWAVDPLAKAEETWGVRSYVSSATQPKPGADVFDVFSLSPKIGLNGIPYREW
jgi:general secretion pathway protein G